MEWVVISFSKKTWKTPLKRLLDLIKEFRKVVGYKISIQKSVVFLYTNKELSEIESKKTISFNITSKWIIYPGINEVKDLYSENYKSFDEGNKKMIKRNRKLSHALGLEELILLKCPYYPEQSTDLMQSL